MPDLVIVALPSEDDYVNKISSEKVPHMTLLFLGNSNEVRNLNKILEFTKHAVDETLCRFGLEVDKRGELGEDKADVLFFKKSRWSGYSDIEAFRSNLLKENNIRTTYNSVEQHSEWIPHITLGYPETPANPDERDYPGITYVNFDRIAVWDKEFEGVEFPLDSYDEYEMMRMSAVGRHTVDEIFLEHFGVKGMRWGHRSASSRSKPTYRSHPDSKLSSDAEKKLKTRGIHTLSNQELRTLADRRNLEKRIIESHRSPILRGSRTTAKILNSPEARLSIRVAKSQIARETAAVAAAAIVLALGRAKFG